MSFFVLSRAQAKAIRAAFRQQEGLPARGVTVGPVAWEPPTEVSTDENGDPLPTPGWTTEALDVGDEDGGMVAIEVPQRFERFAGKKVKGVQLPALVDEADLPVGIKTKRAQAREGTTP